MAVYLSCVESFTTLPISAVLDRRFLCVHGGISPELNTVTDINKVSYNAVPAYHGAHFFLKTLTDIG